jgi:uncharacterized protein (DUF4415 family)
MNGEYIVRYVGKLDDGTHVIRRPDGGLERRKSQTDWKRVDAMTDEDVERAIADDPDWAEFRDIDWTQVETVRNEVKTPISIRLDPDVLAFFKAEGAGYQKRINAVLRSFVAQKKKARAAGAKPRAKPKRAGKAA